MPSKMKSFLFVVAMPLLVFFASRSMFGLFQSPAQETSASDPVAVVAPVQQDVQRYDSVGDYFKAGNPNATSHRLGLPLIERDVSGARKRSIKDRCGCCVVCGSTNQLEVEHRRGLQNGGDNSDENLSVLCHECHVEKTRMDKSLRRQRDKLVKQRR